MNGRLDPAGVVEGFTVDVCAAATDLFCTSTPHVKLPVTTFHFNLSEDSAPSPYLVRLNL